MLPTIDVLFGRKVNKPNTTAPNASIAAPGRLRLVVFTKKDDPAINLSCANPCSTAAFEFITPKATAKKVIAIVAGINKIKIVFK